VNAAVQVRASQWWLARFRFEARCADRRSIYLMTFRFVGACGGSPACRTDTGLPPIVSVAFLAGADVFAATV
jgi:hypothetical protein